MRENYDFDVFFETLTGHREGPFAMPGVVNIAEEGSAYSRAYQTLMDARLSLTRRFGMDFEDKDLERIMEAVSVIEREAARGAFRSVG